MELIMSGGNCNQPSNSYLEGEDINTSGTRGVVRKGLLVSSKTWRLGEACVFCGAALTKSGNAIIENPDRVFAYSCHVIKSLTLKCMDHEGKSKGVILYNTHYLPQVSTGDFSTEGAQTSCLPATLKHTPRYSIRFSPITVIATS